MGCNVSKSDFFHAVKKLHSLELGTSKISKIT